VIPFSLCGVVAGFVRYRMDLQDVICWIVQFDLAKVRHECGMA
jgi:hypothetical protein